MTSWLAGAATSLFTVPRGTALGGYADRPDVSRGTADQLEINALVLQAEDATLHIVAADVIGVDPSLVDEIAAAAEIASNALILAASHTHSGPIGVPLRLLPASDPTVDPVLRRQFVNLASDAIRRASAGRAGAVLQHGTVDVPGAWSNRNNPELAADSRVRVLAVRGAAADDLVALVALIPCHPTILGASNLLVSADLHGGIRRALRTSIDDDVPILTLTGAAGDVSTRFTRRESTLRETDRLGAIVTEPLASALPDLAPVAPGLTGMATEVRLIPRHLDPHTVQGALKAAQNAWQVVDEDTTASEAARRVAWTRLQGAEIQARIADLPPVEAPLLAWRLGDELAIVTIPGELFSSLGQQIESSGNGANVWVVGYANGYIGYLVDSDAVSRGTYEAFASPWSTESSGQMVTAATELVERLMSASTDSDCETTDSLT